MAYGDYVTHSPISRTIGSGADCGEGIKSEVTRESLEILHCIKKWCEEESKKEMPLSTLQMKTAGEFPSLAGLDHHIDILEKEELIKVFQSKTQTYVRSRPATLEIDERTAKKVGWKRTLEEMEEEHVYHA